MAGFTVPEITSLLESQRETERRFVAEAATEPDFPGGWTSGLLMAHIASWRNRLRDSLIEVSRGLPVSGPPADIDGVNDAQLARDARMSLDEAAAQADTRLADLLDLWPSVGDRPFSWFTAKTIGRRSSAIATSIHDDILPSTMSNAATQHGELDSRVKRWLSFGGSVRRKA